MAIIKFKVIASCTDRLYFSRIYQINDIEFDGHEEIMDHISELCSEDTLVFDHRNWKEEGSEDVGGGFRISEITRI
jgi:hypothetical protein